MRQPLEIASRGLDFRTKISKTTLYSYIDKGIFFRITNKSLPVKGIRRNKIKKVKTQARANAGVSIEKRPEEVLAREEFGHWEMDSVIGRKGESKHSLLVFTERKTRLEIICLLYEHTAEQVCNKLDQLEKKWGKYFREIFKTITVDNGSEFADWKRMTRSVLKNGEERTKIYYCHPYCSFERGSNENQNKLVRRKIPKGTNFDDKSEGDIQGVEDWINNYPRKLFEGKNASHMFKIELEKIIA